MPELETPDADAVEQQQGRTVGTDDVADLGAPEADAAEQAALADPVLAADAAPSLSREADAADVAEQDAVVEYDDDEYR